MLALLIEPFILALAYAHTARFTYVTDAVPPAGIQRATPRIHSPSFPPFYRSTRFSLSWKNYTLRRLRCSWSAYNRPLLSYLVPITRDRLILTPFARRLDDFLGYRCNPLSEMTKNIRTNNSEYFERRFKVAASRGED